MAGLRLTWQAYVEGVKRVWHLKRVKELTLWDFRKEECLKQWNCISDEEKGGYSKATFQLNKKGTGSVFEGVLNTNVKETHMKYSGYCAIRSKPLHTKTLFGSSEPKLLDVSDFDAFEIRVRGDGRKFVANVKVPSLVPNDDLWQCFVFTRGGPEWEDIRIPFEHFFLTNRGYLQDGPASFGRPSFSTFGLLIADKVNGPFKLEIQYIKAIRTIMNTF